MEGVRRHTLHARQRREVHGKPRDALRKTVAKFITRFHHIESALLKQGRDLSSTPMDELERLWQEAKSPKRQD
ncbi:MAG: hypothetical protein HS130_06715 [Deltaproteobacteria bacterium]|nr:hypothetical protein [Deltaproteobacteria bacterium]